MGNFKNGLFDCFGNITISVMATFFPCIVLGQNAVSSGAINPIIPIIPGRASCIMFCCFFFIPGLNCYGLYKIRKSARMHIRAPTEFRSLDDRLCCDDSMVGICYWWCSLIQIRRHYIELEPDELTNNHNKIKTKSDIVKPYDMSNVEGITRS